MIGYVFELVLHYLLNDMQNVRLVLGVDVRNVFEGLLKFVLGKTQEVLVEE
jgi:hypothetical protein